MSWLKLDISQKRGKLILNNRAELCKERFLKIHEVLVKNLKKNERLKQEAKDLHTKLTLEINKFENAQKH